MATAGSIHHPSDYKLTRSTAISATDCSYPTLRTPVFLRIYSARRFSGSIVCLIFILMWFVEMHFIHIYEQSWNKF